MGLYKEVTDLFYDCCYGKGKVELGFPNNFESSKVNVTAFERELKKITRKYELKKVESHGKDKTQ